MSTIKVDSVTGLSTDTNLALKAGGGTGKVAIGDDELLFPDTDGSDGQVIKTDGNRALSFVDAGGGGEWQFVSAVTASSSPSVSFTGLESGYDHLVTMLIVLPATDNQIFNLELGITGPTYRTSGYLGSEPYPPQES
jgi:hypothetical protein